MKYFNNDEIAIVTGSASGIGRACAVMLAREGARIIVSDIDEDGGNETVQMIKDKGGDAQFKSADVSKPEEFEALIQFAEDTYGGLNILVNNAGVGGEAAPVADYDLDNWNQVIAINQSSVFYGMKYAIPAMLKNGGGSIINIASILGQVGFANSVAYVSAKHAVVGMTKVAALEYSAQGIRVNAVGPAFINTPLLSENEDMTEEALEQVTSAHPIGRLGEPDEVAEFVTWLCSSRASFCTGAYYPVDGAYLAQ